MPLKIRSYADELLRDESYDWWDETFAKIKKTSKSDSREIEKMMREFARLTRPHYWNKKKKKKTSGNGGGGGHFSSSVNKQRCTVKCSYEKSSFRKHMDFLKIYMPQENKDKVIEKPHLFSATEDIASDEALLDYQKNMDQKFWRFIISPARQDIPMEVLVRNFIKQIELKTGYELSWFAAKHTDTANIHSHILINGKDKNGKDVKFEKFFFKSLFRELASDICTALKGPRTQQDIDMERKKLVIVKRWCRLDAQISLHCSPNLIYSSKEYESIVKADNEEMQARLTYLEELGLAKRIGSKVFPSSFLLEKDWEDKLHTMGNYNSFIDARDSLKYTGKINLQLYKATSGHIEGEITHIFKHDFEGAWSNAIVIENQKLGKAWFVPLRSEPNEKLKGAKVEFNSRNNGKQTVANKLKVITWGQGN